MSFASKKQDPVYPTTDKDDGFTSDTYTTLNFSSSFPHNDSITLTSLGSSLEKFYKITSLTPAQEYVLKETWC
ncbi:MAG: hypothetical protein OQK82_01670 [Candidatus Pacearchaeota archaeon]|nr:hypothetical protein [Candidatus Pacearchaeota archaeon]